MLTHLLGFLLIAYAIAAFAALLTTWLCQGPPAYFDRASTYGDEKLNWQERTLLIVFLPAFLLFVYVHDKWPGVKEFLVDMWVAIWLGRQPNTKDHQ
jgi:hypothetical protein